MQKKLKSLRRILAVLIVLSVCLSALFVMAYASHDCVGDGCKICEMVQLCLRNLNNLLAASLVFAATAPIFALIKLLMNGAGDKSSETPITLKVKLLN